MALNQYNSLRIGAALAVVAGVGLLATVPSNCGSEGGDDGDTTDEADTTANTSTETEPVQRQASTIEHTTIGGEDFMRELRLLVGRALAEKKGPQPVTVYNGTWLSSNTGGQVAWVGVTAPDLCAGGFHEVSGTNGFALINEEADVFTVAYLVDCDDEPQIKVVSGVTHQFNGSDICYETRTCAEVFGSLNEVASSSAAPE